MELMEQQDTGYIPNFLNGITRFTVCLRYFELEEISQMEKILHFIYFVFFFRGSI